ncbi:MAG: heterodisulfide reductase subunit F [Gracilibacter sp. BRH_c7a]|nr:MAG: heterodisulfide reductase subunit F [Gracilibacter sp. BRH_c7a]
MNNPYVPYQMRVVKVVDESPERDLKTIDLSFIDSDIAESFSYTPGQFAEVSVAGIGEAPFGIASAPCEPNLIRFSIKKVGLLTCRLHEAEEGDIIGIRGPLGNGWPMGKLKGKDLVIIGGGFAFTTLRSLVRYIIEPENRQKFGKLDVVYGNRNPGQMLYKEEMSRWAEINDLNLYLTIDRAVEGWQHYVGFVPQITEQVIKASVNAVAIVCGPPVMIKFTMPVLKQLGFESNTIYTSLEMKMKCGIGHCGRCNIGDKYVCKDGPVFSLAELERLPAEY